MIFWIIFSIISFLIIAVLAASLVCFFRIFYSPARQEEEYPIPDGEIYEVYRDQMIQWIKDMRAAPHKDLSIRSFDGLTLRGKYYEYSKDAPIEILFHGYKGSAERDLSGGVARCFSIGHSALIVDHRASGNSEGHVITFGVNERRDCIDWVNYVVTELAPDAKIIITGISMGAATVMMAASEVLPENVIGVLADCGYTSPKAIIKKVIEDMKLPADIIYPFARLGARIFGRFDLEETSPVESMKKSRLPVIFFHGDNDDFVPYEMSVENYNACITTKRLVRIEGAGHGLAFPVNREKYLSELDSFFDPILKNKK